MYVIIVNMHYLDLIKIQIIDCYFIMGMLLSYAVVDIYLFYDYWYAYMSPWSQCRVLDTPVTLKDGGPLVNIAKSVQAWWYNCILSLALRTLDMNWNNLLRVAFSTQIVVCIINQSIIKYLKRLNFGYA